jgi:predicted DNA-binding protein (MmcQ/YjbR family)
MNLNKAKTLCRGFPGATEDIKWGDALVFSVGTKMFAITGAGPNPGRICFKVDDDAFLALTDRPGIVPAPYLARAKWVQIADAKAVSDAEAAQLLTRAYELVFARLTKKLQREIAAPA